MTTEITQNVEHALLFVSYRIVLTILSYQDTKVMIASTEAKMTLSIKRGRPGSESSQKFGRAHATFEDLRFANIRNTIHRDVNLQPSHSITIIHMLTTQHITVLKTNHHGRFNIRQLLSKWKRWKRWFKGACPKASYLNGINCYSTCRCNIGDSFNYSNRAATNWKLLK